MRASDFLDGGEERRRPSATEFLDSSSNQKPSAASFLDGPTVAQTTPIASAQAPNGSNSYETPKQPIAVASSDHSSVSRGTNLEMKEAPWTLSSLWQDFLEGVRSNDSISENALQMLSDRIPEVDPATGKLLTPEEKREMRNRLELVRRERLSPSTEFIDIDNERQAALDAASSAPGAEPDVYYQGAYADQRQLEDKFAEENALPPRRSITAPEVAHSLGIFWDEATDPIALLTARMGSLLQGGERTVRMAELGAAYEGAAGVTEQLSEKGEVHSPEDVGARMLAGATITPALDKAFLAMGAGIRKLREIRKTPDADSAALDDAIAAQEAAFRSEAEQGGLTPGQAESALMVYSETPDGTIAAPRQDALKFLDIDEQPNKGVTSADGPGQDRIQGDAVPVPDKAPEMLHDAGGSGPTGPEPEVSVLSKEATGESDGVVEALGQRVRQVEAGALPSGILDIKSPADAAHVAASIRKDAQESLIAIVTDDNGTVLRTVKISRGTLDTSAADQGILAGSIVNTPGASKAWIAHNHPSGKGPQMPSEADQAVTATLADTLSGSGVSLEGSVIVGPGGRNFASIAPDGSYSTPEAITAAPRKHQIPLTERRLLGQETPEPSVVSSEDMHNALTRHSNGEEGILLMDAERRPIGWVAMSSDDMRNLRTGKGGGSDRLLSAMDEVNAHAFAARTGNIASIGNLDAFGKRVNRDLIDAVDFDGRSAKEHFGDLPSQSTFYSNPFLVGTKQIASDLKLNPGRNLAAGFAGGTYAGISSKEEVGSPQWWNDVAFGTMGGVTLGQAVRHTRLLGKGSIADNALAKTGKWIESLPFLGRGPSEVRNLKKKQRLMEQLLDQQTEKTGEFLLKNFTPSERAQIADLIEGRGIVKDLNLIHRQAQALDDYLTNTAKRMKELKMLPEDLEEGGYLHRYYAKHLGLDKMFKQAKRQQGLSGSYTIARGMEDVFPSEFLSPGARKSAEGEELLEFMGVQNGKMRSFFFTKDEVPRVEGKPVLAQKDKQGISDGWDHGIESVRDLVPTDRVWTVKGLKEGQALLHRDWTKAERQSWGEIGDAGYRYVRGMAEASHDLSLASMFDTISKRSKWVSESPSTTNGKDWIYVPDSKVHKNSPLRKYGALAGKYVRPDVWNSIKGYGRSPFAPGRAGQVYRGALNRWKMYKTVYNPVTHLNNTWSNVELLHMAGYSPKDLVHGFGEMSKGEKSELWREARDNGLFGTDWSSSILKTDEGGGNRALSDLAEALRTQPDIPDAELVTDAVIKLKEWWIGSSNAVADAKGPWKTGAALAKAINAPAAKLFKSAKKPIDMASRAAQKAYQFEDEVFKMAVFAAERKKGVSPEKAVEAAQRYFFDYQDLPDAVKWVRDLPVGSPFVSYTYFAVPAVAKSAVQNPEKVLALIAAYEAWNYGAMLAGEDAPGVAPGEYWATHEAEDKVSPPWERGRALWGGLNTIHMPSPEGYRLAIGRAHALGNPFMSEAGGREKLPTMPYLSNFWGSSMFGSSPMHALLDVAVNEDWKGKAIYDEGAPDSEKAKKAAAYLYQAWAPSNIVAPGGYHQQRVLEGLANDVRKNREQGQDPGVIGPVVDIANEVADALGFEGFTGLDRMDNEISSRDALLASFGIKLRPIRFEQSMDFELQGIERDAKKNETWFDRLSTKSGEGRISDQQVDAASSALDELLLEQEKKEDELFNADKLLRKQGRMR